MMVADVVMFLRLICQEKRWFLVQPVIVIGKRVLLCVCFFVRHSYCPNWGKLRETSGD